MLEVLTLLKSGKYESSTESDMDGQHAEIIYVEDYGNGVLVRGYYDEDGPKHSIETPIFYTTINVGGYTITLETDVCESCKVESSYEEYAFDENDESWKEICDFLKEEYDYSYDWFDRVDWAEWTEDELCDEIINELSYDQYILIDGEYLGDYDEEEHPDKETYSREEVARDLASKGFRM